MIVILWFIEVRIREFQQDTEPVKR